MVKPKPFSKDWYERDFEVPMNRKERVALRLQLEQESRMGRSFMEGGKQNREVLLIRLRMIEAVDSGTAKDAVA